MLDFFAKLAQNSEFMPHGECLIWDRTLLALHVGSDLTTGLAYYAIAIAILYVLIKRRDIPFHWLLLLFPAFILSCGTTHFFNALTVYLPWYWEEGNIKLANAIISAVTALVIVPIMPKILALPSLSKAMARINELNQDLELRLQELQREIQIRKEAEEELRTSETRFRTLVGNIPGTVYRFHASHPWLVDHMSEEILSLSGYPASDFIENRVNYGDLIHPADRAGAERQVAEAIANQSRYEMEYRLLPKQGPLRWVYEKGQPSLGDREGEVHWLDGVIFDISERKMAAQQLNSFFELSIDMLCITDQDGHFLGLNPAFEKTLGYPRAELLGKSFLEFIHPDDLQSTQEAAEQLRLGVPAIQFANRCRCLDQSYKWLEWTAIPDPELGVSYAIARDQTTLMESRATQERLEQQLRQALKMEAIGTLAGGIAHDFNNILAAILGYADMAREDLPEGSRAQNEIEQVIKAGTRAAELVKQILAFSRKSVEARTPIAIHLVVLEALKLLRASIPTTIAIDQQIDPTCGQVLADPTQIHQVVMNLCTNAAQAMEEKGGTLTVTLGAATLTAADLESDIGFRPGNYVRLTVGDNGPGIEPSLLHRIFDPYFTTKKIGKGSGMGLAVVHGIVKSHEGLVRVHSTPGLGTTFHIYLPAVAAAAPAISVESGPLPTGEEHILVVDDEESMVKITAERLQRLGYRVTTTTSSPEALALFTRQPEEYDLLLTDQTMPTLTGEGLALKIRALKPATPVILCTGYSSRIDANQAQAEGIKYFLMKPVDRRLLAQTVRQALDENKQPPSDSSGHD